MEYAHALYGAAARYSIDVSCTEDYAEVYPLQMMLDLVSKIIIYH